MLYYKCGKLGHVEDQCASRMQTDTMVIDTVNDQLNDHGKQHNAPPAKPKDIDDYGDWMLVKKPGRKHNPKTDKAARPMVKRVKS